MALWSQKGAFVFLRGKPRAMREQSVAEVSPIGMVTAGRFGSFALLPGTAAACAM